MAVKIIRQAKSIALLGVPVSVASLAPGHEHGPQALRAAGIVTQLTGAGFAVTDYGDCTTRASAADDEHPHARNVDQVLATIEELRPKVEIAVKSGALPLILGGDSSIVLGTIAGARRYFRGVSLIYLNRDAGLNVPATTPSGCLDGMVISHVIGRGAPELVRFWSEPPLVREPEVALFGFQELDSPEQQFLANSPLRRYPAEDLKRTGAADAAERAVRSVHADAHEFILHLDVNVIAAGDFQATNRSVPDGLRLNDVRRALAVFARRPGLTALEISGYNPALDPEQTAARQLIDLVIEILTQRLHDLSPDQAEAANSPAAGAPAESATPVSEPGPETHTG